MKPSNIPPPIPKQPSIQPEDPMSPDRRPHGRKPEGRPQQQQQQGGQQQQHGGNAIASIEKDHGTRARKTVEPVDDADDDAIGHSRR